MGGSLLNGGFIVVEGNVLAALGINSRTGVAGLPGWIEKECQVGVGVATSLARWINGR